MLWRKTLVVATAARAFTTVPVAVEQRSRRHTNVARSNFVDDLTAVATDFLSKLVPAPAPYNASNVAPGHVHRCAVKAKNLSRAPGWTTNKPSVPGMGLGLDGCAGDFNNYRSAALQNTRDRGVSIITTDVYKALTGEGWPVQHGDLGENLFVDMPYATFAVGRRFLIGMTALVEITEAIVPCAYLCQLSYLSPRWRCNDFIRGLAGRRGWYAKVLVPGYVAVGDAVVAMPT